MTVASRFIIPFVILAWAMPLQAGTRTGKVVRVSGATVTISVGRAHGVKDGYSGEVFYHLSIAGQKKRISVAQFSVQSVSERTSKVRVYNTKAPVNTGYLLLFDQTLSARKVRVAPKEKGNVYVASEPTGATVFVNGKKSPQPTPTLIEGVVVGEARIELRKDFYFGTAVVKVTKGQLSKVNVELKAEPAEVKFLSKPFEARVFIDGDAEGTTPVFIKDLKAGRHTVRMEKEHHIPAEETIFVKGGSKETITLTLKPFGMVKLKLEPKDAELTIDGEEQVCKGGQCELKLEAGAHEILVTMDKYLTHRDKFTLGTGEDKALAIALTGYPSISISSEPEKVYVSLQGNKLGRTPLKLEFPEAGDYDFVLSKDQYAEKHVKVTLTAGKREKVHVKLLTLPKVIITTTPDDAEVWLQKKKMGVTPLTLTMEPGTYVFTLKKKKYRTIEARAQVDLGDATTIDRPLEYLKEVALALEKEAALASVIKTKTILGWTFTGVGVAAIGGSIPFFLGWQSSTDSADTEYDKYQTLVVGTEEEVFDTSIGKVHDNADSAKTNFIVAVSLAVTGAASTAYGLYNLLTIPARAPKVQEPKPATVTFTPYHDGRSGGMILSGTW